MKTWILCLSTRTSRSKCKHNYILYIRYIPFQPKLVIL